MLSRITGLVIGILLSLIIAVEVVFPMINSTDDTYVMVGFGILGMLGLVYLNIGFGFIKSIKKSLQSRHNSNIHQVLLLLMIVLVLSACTTIEPGHVGIRVYAYGANKGVDDYPSVTGRVWYNPWNTDIIQYPVFVQNVSWTKDPGEGHPINEEISFNTGDQMVVYADISLAYQLEQTKAPAFYVKFRADDIEKWTHGFLRNITRQKFDEVAGRYKIEQIMGDNAPFLKEVREIVQKELDPYGVHLEQMGFNGSPRPPQAVIDAINGKVKATQDAIRVENEIRQTEAQAKKDIAKAEGEAKAAIARAEGEAKANQIVNSSISVNLLEWRRLEISSNATQKWNGQLPTYSGGTMPFLQLPGPK
jgi:regulator of protease activity HflC (stomatin/prohibitin superfamily)